MPGNNENAKSGASQSVDEQNTVLAKDAKESAKPARSSSKKQGTGENAAVSAAKKQTKSADSTTTKKTATKSSSQKSEKDNIKSPAKKSSAKKSEQGVSAKSAKETREKVRALRERARASIEKSQAKAEEEKKTGGRASQKPKKLPEKEPEAETLPSSNSIDNQIPDSLVQNNTESEPAKRDSKPKYESGLKHNPEIATKKRAPKTTIKETTKDEQNKANPKMADTSLATDGNAKSAEPSYYNNFSTPIFNKPIFVYHDEVKEKPQDKIPTEPEEINDESLNMLLDLQIDDDETPEQSTPAPQSHEAINEDIIAEIESAIIESQLLDSEENKEDSEENSDLPESYPADNAEEAKIDTDSKEDGEKAEDTEEIFSPDAPTDYNESDGEKISTDEEDAASAPVSDETSDEEEQSEPEPELPPLMDIEHFSDYLSKSDAASRSDEENSSEDSESPEGEEEETYLTNEALLYSPKTDSDVDLFQHGFFDAEIKKSEPVDEQPVTKKKKKEIKAEPKVLADEMKYDPKKPRRIDFRFDFIELFVFTLVAVMVLTTFVFKHSIVEGPSMENTLQDGDHLIVLSIFYSPEPGDIIVFEDYSTGLEKPLVKRVIAVGGQTVDIDVFGFVYVDGVQLDEKYVYKDGFDAITRPGTYVVPEGEVFVMGDHRNNSTDSRTPSFGTVKEDAILGKVVLRFYPFDSFGTVD